LALQKRSKRGHGKTWSPAAIENLLKGMIMNANTNKAQNKTVIVTGASSGIGLAIAEAYVKLGYNVVGNARTLSRLQEAAEKLGKRFVPVDGDIGDPATAKRLFDTAIAQFGKVDILINNAGIFLPKPFAEYTPDDVDRIFDTNLKGFLYVTQLAGAHMAGNRSGHIVNVTASVAMQPTAKISALLPVLVKGGLNQATRALAIELASSNVMVNAVAPGIIDTPMHAPETHDFLKALHPTNTLGSSQDIVDAVLYLTSASFTTGAILAVDGGASAGTW
jgi:NAD(P)-dependent dehydrogenase (short-subunit alcohol dehydrogenase family)